jgi:hypothetical protein
MLERFDKVKNCILKSLIDLGLDGLLVVEKHSCTRATRRALCAPRFVFGVTITYFVFVLGSWPKQFFVLHVFWLRQSEPTAVVYSRFLSINK